jgi:hypothetical protein
MRFFNTAGVEDCTYAATMDVTMDIGLGCLRHLFLQLCITENYLLYERDVYKG